MSTEYDINLSDGSVRTTLYALESDGPNNVSTPRLILATDMTAETFELSGDLTFRFVPGFRFTVSQSAGGLNDGVYSVLSSSYAIGPNRTTILIDTGPIVPPTTKNDIVSEAPPLGQINYSIGAATALLLPGKGTVNYGEQIVETLVRMTEHWASAESAPGSGLPDPASPAGIGTPLFGQLWWNNDQEVMFRYTQTDGWTSDIHMGTGSLFFVDPENPFDPTTEIELTAAGDDVGMSISTLLNPNPLDSILNVYDDDKTTIRFRVEHEGFFGGNNALNVAGSAGGQDSWIDTNLSINRGSSDTMGGVVAAPHTAVPGVAFDVGGGNIRIDDNEGIESVTGARLSTGATGVTFAARPANGTANRFTVQDSIGTNKLFVSPTGDIGINRVPLATLDVRAESVQDYFRVDNNTPDLLFLVASDNTVESVNTFYVDRANSTLVVDTVTDRVGINQGTPLSALDVTGSGHFTGRLGINNPVPVGTVFLEVTGDLQVNSQLRGSDQTQASPTYSFTNHTDLGMYARAANELCFSVAGLDRACVSDTAFSVDNGLIFSAPDGLVSAPSYTFNNDTATGMFLNAAGELGIASDGFLTARFGDDVFICAQDGVAGGSGEQITLQSGHGDSAGAGGVAELIAGDGGVSGAGGISRVRGGIGNGPAAGGSVSISGGTATGTGAGGGVNLVTGPSVSGNTGGINIATSDVTAPSAESGAIIIDAGNATGVSNPGVIRLSGGNIVNGTMSEIRLEGGISSGTAPGGRVTMIGGSGSASGTVGGTVTMEGGPSVASGTAGSAIVRGGTANATGTGGAARLEGGLGGLTSGTGGSATVMGGGTINGLGGLARVQGGSGSGSNPGGSIFIQGGNSGPTALSSSNVTIQAGSAAGGSGGIGGNIILNAGNGDGGGFDGQVQLSDFGTETRPIITWSTDSDTGIFRPAGDTFAITSSGTEVLRLHTSEVTLGAPILSGAVDIDLTINAGDDILDDGGNTIVLNASDGGPTSDGGDIEINAGNSGATGSAAGEISLTAGNAATGTGAAGGDVNLVGGVGAAPTAGFQEVDVGGTRVGGDTTGLANDTAGFADATNGSLLGTQVTAAAANTYDFDVTIDGGGLQQLSVVLAGGETYSAIAALMDAVVVGGTVAYNDPAFAFRVTSSTLGTGSAATIAPGTAGSGGGDLFAALDAAETVTHTFPAATPGVTTTYTATVAVDGGGAQPISIDGGTAQTYTTLLSELNADTTGAVWSLMGGNIVCTSSTTGSSSTIGIVDTDVFSSLTDFVAINGAVAGVDGGGPGVVNSLSPHVMSAGMVIPPAAFLEIVPGPKAGLSLGVGLAGFPPGTMTVVIDDATGPTAFVLAIVDGAGTWVRTDTYAAIT